MICKDLTNEDLYLSGMTRPLLSRTEANLVFPRDSVLHVLARSFPISHQC